MITKHLKNIFSSFSTLKVPIVDVEPYLKGKGNFNETCKEVADALHKYGCLIIKDPRVKQSQNAQFLDMMEKYFAKRAADLYEGRKLSDIYPNYNFQVGATPEYTQKARAHKELIQSYKPQNKALTPVQPPFDAKWRYFWNIGNPVNDCPNQSPVDFPQWGKTMDLWGNHMLNGCNIVAQMAAIGLGLQKNTFTKLMQNGPHKLAPTGSDLTKYDVSTVFAGFHYDFNFLTIHGKSRYPGLFAWLRTGQKFTVSVPQGHLLLQAGKQFQYLTGGYINCGYHQVIYTDAVKQAKQKAIKQGRIPWRVSSTLFSHIRYGVTLQPLGKYRTAQTIKKYPAVDSKEFSLNQLDLISLKR